MRKTMARLFDIVSNENYQFEKFSNENEDYNINGYVTLKLSVSNSKRNALVYHGRGKTFNKAIKRAIKLYKKNKPKDFIAEDIKLDLITEVLPWNKNTGPTYDLNNKITPYTRRKFGIAFDDKLKTTFTPHEVVAYDLITKRKLNQENLDFAFKERGFTLKHDLIKSLYIFKTAAWYANKNEVYRLFQGHKFFKKLHKKTLWNAIALTKDNYFKHFVNQKGKQVYSYYPAYDEYEHKYNILRHAGSVFSMIQTYDLMPDEELLNNIEKSLEYLIGKTKLIKHDKEQRVVVERDKMKLGGNALAIIAMAEYTKVTKDYKYVQIMQELANWIKNIQRQDGSFSVHIQNYKTGEIQDFISGFYPGQTVFALSLLYNIDGNKEWLNIAEKAADYLITVKNKNATRETIHRDHWFLYGLNELYRLVNRERYINYSLLMFESIRDIQYTKKGVRKEWIGGISASQTRPKSVVTACFSEGLGQTYKLCKDYGYEREAKEIKKVIISGVQFLLQMQLREDSTMYYKDKGLCLGGFHSIFTDINIRNDFTQHNISACIACYNLLD